MRQIYIVLAALLMLIAAFRVAEGANVPGTSVGQLSNSLRWRIANAPRSRPITDQPPVSSSRMCSGLVWLSSTSDLRVYSDHSFACISRGVYRFYLRQKESKPAT